MSKKIETIESVESYRFNGKLYDTYQDAFDAVEVYNKEQGILYCDGCGEPFYATKSQLAEATEPQLTDDGYYKDMLCEECQTVEDKKVAYKNKIIAALKAINDEIMDDEYDICCDVEDLIDEIDFAEVLY